MMGDDIYLKILTDKIRIRDEVVCFKGPTAEYKSGARTSEIDAVVLATGYAPEASFVDIDLVQEDGRMDLYNMMLPLSETHHSLAFIGFLAGEGPVGPPSELQARYIAKVITGKMPPPSEEVMEKKRPYAQLDELTKKGKIYLFSTTICNNGSTGPRYGCLSELLASVTP